METKDGCSSLSTELEEMRVSRKISNTALSTIDAVVEECKSREKFWLSNMELSPQVAFVLYHASRNTRIIFGKMHSRFIHATQLHENPKVVNDAAIVFPELSEMCSLLDSLRERARKITPEMVQFIRRRVKTLRNTAQKASMLPTVKEEVESVDKAELTRELEELAADLRVNLI